LSVKGYVAIASRQVDKEMTRECASVAGCQSWMQFQC